MTQVFNEVFWFIFRQYGKYAENTVFQILKHRHPSVYYWQSDKAQKEIDFIVTPRHRPVAVNVCHADDIPKRELESFTALSQIADPERNILVTRNTFDQKIVDGNRIELVPLWVFMLVSEV